MKKIGLIPCRLESTRLPNKPLEMIGSLPMFAHVYYRSLEADLDDIYICTDSKEIQRMSNDLNIKCIMTSKKHKNGTERCGEAVKKLKLSSNDIVVDIQGDEPLLNPKDVSKIANNFNPKKHDILLGYLLFKEKEQKNVVKIVTAKDNRVLYFSRSDIPNTFREKTILKKQVGLVAFSINAINYFYKSKPTKLEEIEGVELLRSVELGSAIYGIELNYETRAVDVPADLNFVREKIKSDSLYQKYALKNEINNK